MKVSRAQAQANRERIVETASSLFRERGYDGIGVADLMAAAGFTHGGFYKHFGSKMDLMAESAACGIGQTVALSSGADAPTFVRAYLSREHRDARASGCTIAALGSDASRQSDGVRATFAEGIEKLVAVLTENISPIDGSTPVQARARALDLLVHAVGAIVVSRACPDDSSLVDEILAACQDEILKSIGVRSAASAPHERAVN
jgi:TetR/AcrR family transcriptional repressor of nem operon